MEQEDFILFDSQEKAIHYTLWMNFQERNSAKHFGIIHGPKDNWAVVDDAFRKEMQTNFLEIPKDYANISYESIRQIRSDNDPPVHLEELCGTFSTMSGELLSFILYTRMPLEKLIRYELASRGYDEKMEWVGFEKAEEIWLKE